jgi:hypothetical protein
VSHPDLDKRLAAIPLSVEIPEDVKVLFDEEKSVPAGPSLEQDFWNHFILL